MAELSVSGPGTIGDLVPGWSVNEQATAAAIGQSEGSVGSASFTAARTSLSEYVGATTVELEHPDLGLWSGRVGSVDLGNLTVGMSAAGETAALVANATARPFTAGTPITGFAFPVETYGYPMGLAVDSQGNSYIYASLPAAVAPTTSTITKWSPEGNYLGTIRDSSAGGGGGNGATTVTLDSAFLALDPTEQYLYFKRGAGSNLMQKVTVGGTYVSGFATSGSGNGQVLSGGPGGMQVAANGNIYLADWGNSRVQVLDANGAYVTKWGTAGSGAGQFQAQTLGDLALDAATNVYTLEGKSTPRVQIFDSTGTYISGFNLPAEIGNGNSIAVNPDGTEIYVQGRHSTGPRVFVLNTSGTVLASWPGGGNLDSSLRTIGNGLHYRDGKLYYRTFSSGLDYVPRGGDRIQVSVPYPTLQAALAYYMNFAVPSLTLDYQATSNPTVAFAGWTGNVWAKIKDLLTAYGLEWAVVDGVFTVRDIGSRTLTISNSTPVRVSHESTGGTRAIAVKYQNATAGSDLVMFRAEQILTVNLLETKAFTYQTNSHPLSFNAVTPTDSLTATPGTYHVQDANGLDVAAASWTYFGGSVTATLGDVPGQIRITVQGPRGIIPGHTGPFSLAQGADSLRTAELVVTGAGVVVAPATVTIATGVDPEQTASEVGSTIDNFGILTADQAYTRASWAQTVATGTNSTIRFDMDNKKLSGFGLDQGSLITYQGSVYRVTDVRYGNVTAQITAQRHVTHADVAVVHGGKTYAQMNTLWSGYTYADSMIKPLRAS